MQFIKFDCHNTPAGTRVRVDLSGCASLVYLVDAHNLLRFRAGDDFTHHGGGGLFRRSPAVLTVPRDGDWTVVVAPQGGRVEARTTLIAA